MYTPVLNKLNMVFTPRAKEPENWLNIFLSSKHFPRVAGDGMGK